MNTLNIMLSNLSGKVIPLGYEGENLYTRVRINCIEVFSEYPDAEVSMVVNPPVGDMYPAVVEKTGVMVVWDITDSVLSSSGQGQAQITFTEDEVIRKSVVFGININSSLVAEGEAPSPIQDWIDNAEATAHQIAYDAAMEAAEEVIESIPEDYTNLSNDVNDLKTAKAPCVYPTASGSIASFADGADGMPVKALTVGIDPVQSGTGDPAPDNVRPISGHTAVTVTRTGKNFTPPIPSSFTSGQVLIDYGREITFNRLSLSMLFSGSFANAGASFIVAKNASGTNTMVILPQYLKKVSDGTALIANTTYSSEAVVATEQNTVTIKQILLYTYPAFTGLSCQNVMLNNGNVPLPYEPFGQSIQIPLGQTVYGGTVDVTEGKLIVDRAIVDLGSLTWAIGSNNKFYNADFNSAKLPNSNTDIANLICSIYVAESDSHSNSFDYNNIITLSTSALLCVRDSRYTDAATFKTAMSGVQLCYELAQPLAPITLTEQEMTTLLGQNNIFADSGDVSVEYPADTKLYIEKRISELQALILENI